MAGSRAQETETVGDVQLTPLGAHDEAALFAVYTVVRSAELSMDEWDPGMREPLLRIQFKAQLGSYRAEFPRADTRLITRDGSPIGWVIVDRSGAALHGIDIALLPAEQSHGIGTQVIQVLQQEAAAGGRPMVITVKRVNRRAQALYDRLGFSVIGEDDAHRFMEWHA